MTSDPTTPDRDRRGADLLARIDELTSERKLADYPDGNGWRFLLLACKREIERLARERDEAHRQASAVELLRGLSADEIRRRLTELDAESRALRTLLRAAIRMESGRQTRQEGTTTAESSPTAWFAVLERAIRTSDYELAAKAQRKLRELGVTVQWPGLLSPGKEGTAHE